MSRELSNWLTSYLKYTENTESAKIYHKWVGLSMLAAALRKKTWFNLGRLKTYPNLYVVLTSEPGVTRKTQAISYGTRILSQVPSIVMSADAITKEALLEDLEECADDAQLPDGTIFKHSSLSVISREFESFLGQKKENTKMLVLLTDLFDCEELPFKYRTKHSGSSTAPAVYLNLLAATTPDSLASSLPAIAIGGGLTSRIMFIFAEDKDHKEAIPEETAELKELKILLIKDLSKIARIVGGYQFTPESKEKWVEWYNNYDERSPARLCKDPAFHSWYSRKPTYVIKIALILAAAKSDNLVIEWNDFQESINTIETVELKMGKAFSAVGRSEITSDVEKVRALIERYKIISERVLMQLIWRDIDSNKFENVISTILRGGLARRDTVGPKGEAGIYYYWMG